MNKNIANLRREYTRKKLITDTMPQNPVEFFEVWFKEALETVSYDANAMHMASVDSEGQPSVRVLLLKDFNDEGFVFYTNFNSRKGKALSINPRSALNFYWPELERQVRIEGKTEKADSKMADEYFDTRPRGSRIGAIISPQSQPVKNREELEKSYLDAEARLKDEDIKRPPHWGGYLLRPHLIEFWQGRESRLHDRIEYIKNADGNWMHRRLAP